MNWSDFRRLIAPLQKKIFLLLGRALLTAIKNTEGTQKIQVTVLSNEIITDVERFQEYGFETYPFANAEVLVLFLNGNREHGIAACVHDRRYRPKDLVEGEICVYTDEDQQTDGHRIHFKRGQVVEENCKQDVINAAVKVEVNTPLAVINAATKIELNSPLVEIGPWSMKADSDNGAGNTRFMVFDVDNGQLERVSVGSADSGEAGYKLLRIPN